MTGELKNKTAERIKKRLEENGFVFSISSDIYLNQFLETGNYHIDAMKSFLELAFKTKDDDLASELSSIILDAIKNGAGQ